ncbi:MAG TPA: chromate resistance protein ChrB domain-containing protein [Gemmatimonadales bacterium]
MNDSTAIQPMASPTREWLFLIHQIPPKPDYFRVKVRRRLARLGAVPLKNSVYVLPAEEDTMEDFQWLRREIEDEGGEATVVRGSLVGGATDEEIATRLQRARGAEPDADSSAAPARVPPGSLWVTRPGPKVDRMASAWLIRRFIDPEARFAFAPAPGGIRFDTYEGEFTHDGDHCTFEVLLRHFGLADPALHAVAEVVHDIDIKDGKFGRPETPGIASVVAGIVAGAADDGERLARGAVVFEGLYAQLAAALPEAGD